MILVDLRPVAFKFLFVSKRFTLSTLMPFQRNRTYEQRRYHSSTQSQRFQRRQYPESHNQRIQWNNNRGTNNHQMPFATNLRPMPQCNGVVCCLHNVMLAPVPCQSCNKNKALALLEELEHLIPVQYNHYDPENPCLATLPYRSEVYDVEEYI